MRCSSPLLSSHINKKTRTLDFGQFDFGQLAELGSGNKKLAEVNIGRSRVRPEDHVVFLDGFFRDVGNLDRSCSCSKSAVIGASSHVTHFLLKRVLLVPFTGCVQWSHTRVSTQLNNSFITLSVEPNGIAGRSGKITSLPASTIRPGRHQSQPRRGCSDLTAHQCTTQQPSGKSILCQSGHSPKCLSTRHSKRRRASSLN